MSQLGLRSTYYQNGTTNESQNETVRDWAVDVFERYRSGAEEVTREDIPE